ncbi:hypothetical protein GLOTRDRAFT_125259 [Gloeophyllum trabeum ATCC 11539]|uniref:Uncharacterized protein n=1 Tax=Gloeophyllum trabeum (strain ATCC 11539 / FP-39264 / Madison 617) TaxID=670483 RepID=S7RVU3_GLOTA|nr:uncharacterized protein GLOTRDRAFT_125259 [Gloeophyllum trabeum ATCC 11539]EPQ58940.1 hypothetical protein GLOTRDRAFT_125259 [Gloeophyllum trabeum ATCC 11539]
MPAGSESLAGHPGPTYISPHSAEVILSEIRPIKLKVDALASINVFLDELLWNVLNASRSLTTDKLKAGLTKVLPTPLGKEALLEAEVELRAYWERTSASTPSSPHRPGDDEKTFNLDLAFELLRLKCQAYSTLNDADEDPDVETRLYERLLSAGAPVSPPKPALVSPAALYLTAILESICEHILSNVGRVAARDSSRTTATVHDLYIALCEDDAIYGLFKTMKVYEQIEAMSRPRRSKSFSRPSDKDGSPLRTGSPSKDSQGRLRLSSDSSTAHGHSNFGNIPAASTSRPSFEKARALKIFSSHNRSSSDQNRTINDQAEAQNGHKKSDSLLTNGSKPSLGRGNDRPAAPLGEFEDDGDSMHFEDLMASDTTMKVSLTPDRLKTMEMYNKERSRREGTRTGKPNAQDAVRPAGSDTDDSSSLNPKRSHGNRRPVLRHVDSIIEDDEENHASLPKVAPRGNGLAPPELMPSRPPTSNNARARSISTSNAVNSRSQAQGLNRKASLNVVSSSFTESPAHSQKKDRPVPKQLDMSGGGPQRTRKIGRRRESLDLDDIMNGSDDDDAESLKPVPKTPKTPKSAHPVVSSTTRELMDFLAEGPPDVPTLPKTTSVTSFETARSPGRSFGLRRMVSKLTRGPSTEQLNGRDKPSDEFGSGSLSRRLPGASATSVSLSQQSLSSKRSYSNVVVATRPPRYPQTLASPPSSPSQGSSEDANSHSPPSSYSRGTGLSRDASDLTMTSVASSVVSSRLEESRKTASPSIDVSSVASRGQRKDISIHPVERSEEDSSKIKSPIRALPTPPASGFKEAATKDSQVKESLPTVQAKPTNERPKSKGGRNIQATAADEPAVLASQAAGNLPSVDEIRDLRRLLSKATSADECRLLIDMLLVKCGFSLDEDPRAAYPSPSPSIDTPLPSQDSGLEQSLVELLLCGSAADVSQDTGIKENNDATVSHQPASHTNNSSAVRKQRREATDFSQAIVPPVIRMEG